MTLKDESSSLILKEWKTLGNSGRPKLLLPY